MEVQRSRDAESSHARSFGRCNDFYTRARTDDRTYRERRLEMGYLKIAHRVLITLLRVAWLLFSMYVKV